MIECKEKLKEFIIHNHVSTTTKSELSGQSPDKYISNLNTLNIKSSVLNNDKNFFDYEQDEYYELISKIRNAPDYYEINKKSGKTINAALNVFEKFLEYLDISSKTYLSIKISNEDSTEVVSAIQNKCSNIVIEQLNQYKEKIAIGQLVFMVPAGDKVRWDKGLTGIAKVSKLPFDQEGKNFKIEVSMFASFKAIPREDFIPYLGSYDAADIGPSTKGSQNQAIKQITVEQTASIIRAVLELRPEAKDDIMNNVDKRLLDIATGKQMILKGICCNYKEKSTKTKSAGKNVIFYGVPGCGKSYYVEHEVTKHIDDANKFRTTFFLDYSNSDFVGQIFPVASKEIVDGKTISKVDYKPVAGPFTKALARAYSTDDEVCLIIEEINRGNAAAIFGDLFQLLDRLKVDSQTDERVVGDSEYPINNDFIERYLADNDIQIPKGINKVYIPRNLTIIATMNTSDQNVFPLDTAFKRRWQRERVVTDWDSVSTDLKGLYVPFTDLTWEEFAKTINEEILADDPDGVNLSEDKQLGAYFVTEEMLTKNKKENCSSDDEEKLRNFVNNVIDYLYNDVTKFNHKKLFREEFINYDELYKSILTSHDSSLGLNILFDEN